MASHEDGTSQAEAVTTEGRQSFVPWRLSEQLATRGLSFRAVRHVSSFSLAPFFALANGIVGPVSTVVDLIVLAQWVSRSQNGEPFYLRWAVASILSLVLATLYRAWICYKGTITRPCFMIWGLDALTARAACARALVGFFRTEGVCQVVLIWRTWHSALTSAAGPRPFRSFIKRASSASRSARRASGRRAAAAAAGGVSVAQAAPHGAGDEAPCEADESTLATTLDDATPDLETAASTHRATSGDAASTSSPPLVTAAATWRRSSDDAARMPTQQRRGAAAPLAAGGSAGALEVTVEANLVRS